MSTDTDDASEKWLIYRRKGYASELGGTMREERNGVIKLVLVVEKQAQMFGFWRAAEL